MTPLQRALARQIEDEGLGRTEYLFPLLLITRVRPATSADAPPYLYRVRDTEGVLSIEHALGRRLGRGTTVAEAMDLLAGKTPPRPPPDPTMPFPEGARVKLVTGGKFSGRIGTVAKVGAGPFREFRYVLLDPTPRERVKKQEFVAANQLVSIPVEPPCTSKS